MSRARPVPGAKDHGPIQIDLDIAPRHNNQRLSIKSPAIPGLIRALLDQAAQITIWNIEIVCHSSTPAARPQNTVHVGYGYGLYLLSVHQPRGLAFMQLEVLESLGFDK